MPSPGGSGIQEGGRGKCQRGGLIWQRTEGTGEAAPGVQSRREGGDREEGSVREQKKDLEQVGCSRSKDGVTPSVTACSLCRCFERKFLSNYLFPSYLYLWFWGTGSCNGGLSASWLPACRHHAQVSAELLKSGICAPILLLWKKREVLGRRIGAAIGEGSVTVRSRQEKPRPEFPQVHSPSTLTWGARNASITDEKFIQTVS